MSFFTHDDDGTAIALYVDDPGAGYMQLTGLGLSPSGTTVAGGRLAEMLTDVTDAVTADAPDAMVRGAGRVSRATCRRLLPQLQKAVLVAVAGESRYERTYVDPDVLPPEPMCYVCGTGSGWDEAIISVECAEYGHRPFAQPGRTWDQATQ